MIKDVIFNPGYTAETTYVTLRVTHNIGFETVEAFITNFVEVLDKALLIDSDLPRRITSASDLFNFYFESVLDDMPWDISEMIESEGWIIGDFNTMFQPPAVVIFNAHRAIESQNGYYIFTPEGERYVC